MSKHKTDINWDLVAKYLVGETNSLETEQLTAWISSNEINSLYFKELERWWKSAGLLFQHSELDVDADWQKVRENTQHNQNRNIFKRIFYSKAVAAAIAALIISGTAFFGYNYLKNESNGTITNNTAIFNSIHVPAGQNSQITLSDGSTVWLNSGSNLQFPASFESDCRLVKLEGEAYFEVAHSDEKPFIVHTLGLEIKVHGTSFNVISYANEDSDVVVLMDGSVCVAGLGSNNDLVLQPGQKIIFSRSKQYFTNLHQADMESETAWRDGKLVFDNVPFGVIAKKLERRYGVIIRIENKNVEKMHFRGTFRKESIEQAIKAIQLTGNFKYKIENDLITIY